MRKSYPATVLIVCGPAGSGKSSIAESLAKELGYDYIEGDTYHSAEAIEKMSRGLPLDDDDRWDWLARLRKIAITSLDQGSRGVVVSCSALKYKYRHALRRLTQERPGTAISFIYLRVDPQVLLQRIKKRQGHYMKDNMLQSQLESLEAPLETETDTVVADANAELEVVCGAVNDAVRSRLQSVEA